MSEPKIRRADEGDTPEIARLAGELGYPSSLERVGARLAVLLARLEGHAVLVAESEKEKLAGWIHVGEVRWLESEAYAEIGGLIVDESQRGRKIGERLVEAAIQWAKETGFGEIRVRSNVVRADAHRFYRRLGFTPVKAQQVFRRPLE